MGIQNNTENFRAFGSQLQRSMHWEYIPALMVLAAVAAFWVGASLNLFAVLKVPDSAVGNVLWMYLMLAAVAGSIVLGGGAVADLARRVNRRKR